VDQPSAAFWAIDFGASFLVFAAIMWWCVRTVNRRSAQGIIKRLERSRAPYSVRSGLWNGVWNPAKKPSTTIFDKGMATYILDDNALVHLVFQPLSGRSREYTGPVPATLQPHSPEHRRIHRVTRLMFSSYLAFIVAGFTVGYVQSHGTPVVRVVWGGVGVVVAMAAAVMILHFLLFGRALRDLTRKGDS
jgi:hypothetical protein